MTMGLFRKKQNVVDKKFQKAMELCDSYKAFSTRNATWDKLCKMGFSPEFVQSFYDAGYDSLKTFDETFSAYKNIITTGSQPYNLLKLFYDSGAENRQLNEQIDKLCLK